MIIYLDCVFVQGDWLKHLVIIQIQSRNQRQFSSFCRFSAIETIQELMANERRNHNLKKQISSRVEPSEDLFHFEHSHIGHVILMSQGLLMPRKGLEKNVASASQSK